MKKKKSKPVAYLLQELWPELTGGLCWNGGGGRGLAWAERGGGRRVGQSSRWPSATRGGAGQQHRLLLECPTLEKTASPVRSCGRRGRRNALGKGRGARGGRGEAGGEVFRQFRALEKATHLGGFRPAGKRWRRCVAACWVVGAARGSSLASGEDDGASRSEFYSPEWILARPSPHCEGRGGCGVVRRSRLRQGHGRLGG